MTSSKTVSWSALVNIGNSESIALTVTGEAESPDEARDVFAFAIGQLIGVANGSPDEATAALVRAYVSRLVVVEETKPVSAPAVPKAKREPKITKPSRDEVQATKAEKQDAAAAQAEEVLAIEKRVADVLEASKQDAKPEPIPTAEEQAKAAVALCVKPPAPAPDPAPSAPPKAEASVPAGGSSAPQALATAPDGEVCEVCGAPVAKSQAKLSRLFLNKTLCKAHMEPNGGQV